jgi:hypothetical protein
VTAFLTVLGAVLPSLAGLQILESFRNGHQLLICARRAGADIAAIQ